MYYLLTVTDSEGKSTNKCVKRTYFNVNCEIYKINADECEKEFDIE